VQNFTTFSSLPAHGSACYVVMPIQECTINEKFLLQLSSKIDRLPDGRCGSVLCAVGVAQHGTDRVCTSVEGPRADAGPPITDSPYHTVLNSVEHSSC